jgi:ligand-binding sensor protein
MNYQCHNCMIVFGYPINLFTNECPHCGFTISGREMVSARVETKYLKILQDNDINVSEVIREAIKKAAEDLK